MWFKYDALNRVKEKRGGSPTGAYLAQYGYDGYNGTTQFGRGQRTAMTDTVGTALWSFDQRGRVLTETRIIDTPLNTLVTGFRYDALDRVITTTYPTGEVVNYTYNAQGLPYSAIGTSTYVQSTTYDIAGRVDVRLLGPGAGLDKQDFDYYPWTTLNGQGRLQYLKGGPPSAATSLQNFTYTYDAVGNVQTIVDPNAGGTQTQTFTYDHLDRLSTAQATGGTDGPYAQETYQYSTIGNLTSKAGVVQTYGTAQAGMCPEGALSKAHAVVTAGSNAYCYDQNGNLRRRNIAFNSYTLNYDGENRLTGVTGSATATFVYDGDGNRVKGTVGGVTTTYIGNYYEWNGTAARKTYYAGSTRVAVLETTSTLYYLLGDHLGSMAITANSTGGFVAEVRYGPWGTTRYTSGTTPTTFRYTGQRQESGLGGGDGLYFYGARWYDPAVGRFVQADSIVPGEASGGVIGYDERMSLASLAVDYHEPGFLAALNAENTFTAEHGYWFQLSDEERQQAKNPNGPSNPQALNRYTSTLNNPLRYVDPTGHRPGRRSTTGQGIRPTTPSPPTLTLAQRAATLILAVPIIFIIDAQLLTITEAITIALAADPEPITKGILLAMEITIIAADIGVVAFELNYLHWVATGKWITSVDDLKDWSIQP